MKKIICSSIIFCSLFLITGKAQNNNQINLQKYWHYRYRLVNYFMAVGGNAGESLPAYARNLHEGNTLVWGEGPRYLGQYIGVLATEYRLLKNNNQPVDQTLTELYFALKALERLDTKAEPQWGKPAALNGFLIRDDVPSNFISTHPQLNSNIPNVWPPYTIGSGAPGFVDTVVSEFTSGNAQDPISTDQYSEVLLGLALVKKCVDNITLQFYDNNGNFYSAHLYATAVAEADRMVSYIKEGGNNFNQPWTIFTPNGEYIGDNNGGWAQGFSHGIAKAGEFITGIDYTGNGSEGAFYSFWTSTQNTEWQVRCPNYRNARMAMSFASVGDCWEIGGEKTTKEGIKYQGDYDAGSHNLCGSYPANHYGFDLFYGAAHRYLHDYNTGGIPEVSLCKMEDILTSAPYNGPYYHCNNLVDVDPGPNTIWVCYQAPNDVAPYGWGSSSRFSVEPVNPEAQRDGDVNFRGNYNGLDYMLFHNLYYLNAQNINFPHAYVPQASPFVSGVYPWWGHTIPHEPDEWNGNITNPSTIRADYKSVTVNSLSVNNNGPADISKGSLSIIAQEGVLLSNTTVDVSCIFSVTCEDLNPVCIPVLPYIVDNYQRLIPTIPPYVMADEFKQASRGNTITSTPNPVKDITEIKFSIQKEGPVAISVYNVLGEVVKTLINQKNYLSGSYTINLDLSSLPLGMYYCIMQTKDGKIVNKIVKE